MLPNLRVCAAFGAGTLASPPPNERLAKASCYQRISRVWRFGGETRAGPAGEDASVPSRYVKTFMVTHWAT
jgi:hypothetical protein